MRRALAFDANHNAVRAHEVFNCGALAEKLGVRGHVKVQFRVRGADSFGNLAIGTHRNSRFGHHNDRGLCSAGDVLGGLHDEA